MNPTEKHTDDLRPSAAVVGGGVAGLTAAYLLAKSHAVTLFEADERLGGHAHTHRLADGEREQHVDSGFIVHNRRNYPQLTRLFDELGVETQEAEMSMSISCRSCGLNYAGGRGLSGITAQPTRLFDRRFTRMLRTIPRFHRDARELLESGTGDPTWGEFLESGDYGSYFIDHYATPLVACVWSASAEDAHDYPARHLFVFLDNHGMLSVKGSPRWRTVVGGSRRYVDALTAELEQRHARIVRSSPIESLTRRPAAIEIATGGDVETFDVAVLATHADQALELLKDAGDLERADLEAIGYSKNRVVIHDDDTLLPRPRRARASWNHHVACAEERADAPVRVDYWMNRLMRLESSRDFVVSLNPERPIDEHRALAEAEYAHPIFTHKAVAAAERLRSAGGRRLAFAGAHLGWGFHEDGCRSGVYAAEKFGAGW
ncbi:MAG: FAD-dependent oxidoreductase [Solirubrobacterales bacterium]